MEVGLDTPYPVWANLPIVANLAATHEPAVAHINGAGDGTSEQPSSETARAAISAGICNGLARRADPTGIGANIEAAPTPYGRRGPVVGSNVGRHGRHNQRA